MLHRVVETLERVADRREQARLIVVLVVVGVEPAHRDEEDLPRHFQFIAHRDQLGNGAQLSREAGERRLRIVRKRG